MFTYMLTDMFTYMPMVAKGSILCTFKSSSGHLFLHKMPFSLTIPTQHDEHLSQSHAFVLFTSTFKVDFLSLLIQSAIADAAVVGFSGLRFTFFEC